MNKATMMTAIKARRMKSYDKEECGDDEMSEDGLISKTEKEDKEISDLGLAPAVRDREEPGEEGNEAMEEIDPMSFSEGDVVDVGGKAVQTTKPSMPMGGNSDMAELKKLEGMFDERAISPSQNAGFKSKAMEKIKARMEELKSKLGV